MSEASIQELCSLSPTAAHALVELAHGRDPRVPTKRAPAKVLSLQMSLSEVPQTVSEGNGARRIVQPLVLGKPDAATRMAQLLQVMLKDLLDRVLQDRCAPAWVFVYGET